MKKRFGRWSNQGRRNDFWVGGAQVPLTIFGGAQSNFSWVFAGRKRSVRRIFQKLGGLKPPPAPPLPPPMDRTVWTMTSSNDEEANKHAEASPIGGTGEWVHRSAGSLLVGWVHFSSRWAHWPARVWTLSFLPPFPILICRHFSWIDKRHYPQKELPFRFSSLGLIDWFVKDERKLRLRRQ